MNNIYRIIIDKIRNPDKDFVNTLKGLSIHIPVWVTVLTVIVVLFALTFYRLFGSDSELALTIIFVAKICVNVSIGLIVLSVSLLWLLRAVIYWKLRDGGDSA